VRLLDRLDNLLEVELLVEALVRVMVRVRVRIRVIFLRSSCWSRSCTEIEAYRGGWRRREEGDGGSWR
jgi:hypothetical protein